MKSFKNHLRVKLQEDKEKSGSLYTDYIKPGVKLAHDVGKAIVLDNIVQPFLSNSDQNYTEMSDAEKAKEKDLWKTTVRLAARYAGEDIVGAATNAWKEVFPSETSPRHVSSLESHGHVGVGSKPGAPVYSTWGKLAVQPTAYFAGNEFGPEFSDGSKIKVPDGGRVFRDSARAGADLAIAAATSSVPGIAVGAALGNMGSEMLDDALDTSHLDTPEGWDTEIRRGINNRNNDNVSGYIRGLEPGTFNNDEVKRVMAASDGGWQKYAIDYNSKMIDKEIDDILASQQDYPDGKLPKEKLERGLELGQQRKALETEKTELYTYYGQGTPMQDLQTQTRMQRNIKPPYQSPPYLGSPSGSQAVERSGGPKL